MLEDKGIRGCCPKCGGSNLKNAGWIKFPVIAEKSEIWLKDGEIVKTYDSITGGHYELYKTDYRTEDYNPELFEEEKFGWECADCFHCFNEDQVKAAVMGPPLKDLAKPLVIEPGV